MTRQDRVALACSSSILVACAIHAFAPAGPIYYPLEHAWRSTPSGDGIAMYWYGRSLWTISAGALTLGIVWLLLRRSTTGTPVPLPAWASRALATITLAVLLVALGHTAFSESANWMR
ncbi:MAG: hypothetical protein IPI67_10860 [Myxococcales bacterium]|nr:hypothetical protein [Myxococcales bacterium]